MKLSASFLVLSCSILPAAVAASSTLIHPSPSSPIAGVWQGYAIVREQPVPITFRISPRGSTLDVEFLNGPADHPDATPASSATFNGMHLVASFDYFARTLDATIMDGELSGTYGPSHTSTRLPVPITFQATRHAADVTPVSAPNAPDISGSWEIATKCSKGESAWEFRSDPPTERTPLIKTVIQRIDGDTGGLWGIWNGTSYIVSHFNAAGPALYSVTPQADGTRSSRAC